MRDAVRSVLEASPHVAYGLVFGSHARDTARQDSDVDVAVGVLGDERLSPQEVGSLVARLEQATGRDVDLVILHEAGIPLAFRIFRDGVEVFVRDRAALVAQKARTIVQWLDFKPLHDRCVDGALKAAGRG
jgi:predicted nucleotidyltransferase